MPVGWDGVIFIWFAMAFYFLAPPLLTAAFYWRAQRPKNLAQVVSTMALYIVTWSILFASPIVLDRLSVKPSTLLVYAPMLLSFVAAIGTLFLVRWLLRHFGFLPSAA